VEPEQLQAFRAEALQSFEEDPPSRQLQEPCVRISAGGQELVGQGMLVAEPTRPVDRTRGRDPADDRAKARRQTEVRGAKGPPQIDQRVLDDVGPILRTEPGSQEANGPAGPSGYLVDRVSIPPQEALRQVGNRRRGSLGRRFSHDLDGRTYGDRRYATWDGMSPGNVRATASQSACPSSTSRRGNAHPGASTPLSRAPAAREEDDMTSAGWLAIAVLFLCLRAGERPRDPVAVIGDEPDPVGTSVGAHES
jgi:hypothetical protein